MAAVTVEQAVAAGVAAQAASDDALDQNQAAQVQTAAVRLAAAGAASVVVRQAVELTAELAVDHLAVAAEPEAAPHRLMVSALLHLPLAVLGLLAVDHPMMARQEYSDQELTLLRQSHQGAAQA